MRKLLATFLSLLLILSATACADEQQAILTFTADEADTYTVTVPDRLDISVGTMTTDTVTITLNKDFNVSGTVRLTAIRDYTGKLKNADASAAGFSGEAAYQLLAKSGDSYSEVTLLSFPLLTVGLNAYDGISDGCRYSSRSFGVLLTGDGLTGVDGKPLLGGSEYTETVTFCFTYVSEE